MDRMAPAGRQPGFARFVPRGSILLLSPAAAWLILAFPPPQDTKGILLRSARKRNSFEAKALNPQSSFPSFYREVQRQSLGDLFPVDFNAQEYAVFPRLHRFMHRRHGKRGELGSLHGKDFF